MTPELIGILAVGATLAGLMFALWRDARAHTNQGLAELRVEVRDQRIETRTDIHSLRTEVRSDFADLRKDVQALTERLSRVEGVIEGLFAGRDPRDGNDDAT